MGELLQSISGWVAQSTVRIRLHVTWSIYCGLCIHGGCKCGMCIRGP